MYVTKEEFDEYKRKTLTEQNSAYGMLADYLNRLEQSIHDSSARLERSIQDLADRTDQRFDRTDERFDRMDERFDRMDERFDRMDERFDRMDERFVRMESRFDKASSDFADHREEDAARFELVKVELSLLHKGQARIEKALTDIDGRLYRIERKELQ